MKNNSKCVLLVVNAFIVLSATTVGVVFGQGTTGLADNQTISNVWNTTKSPNGVGKMKPYELWYDAPALNRGKVYKEIMGGIPYDKDWENWSLPIGNGWMGANVFGRSDTERIQITDNTLANKGPWIIGGLTSFAELYIDINHNSPINYKRSLSLNDAVAYTSYNNDGVDYERSVFASYPDRVMVIKLKASAKGKLSFKLRPVIPYLKSIDTTAYNDYRTGKVFASDDVITLSGKMGYFNVVYEGQFKVLNYGGFKKSFNDANGDNGIIVVRDADSAIILVAVGTNYKLSSKVFTEKDNAKKLDGVPLPHNMVTNLIQSATKKTYNQLLQNHLQDYHQYFDRVKIDFGSTVPSIPTDKLLANYKKGQWDAYLEELYFQYGRYLLISSSRLGTLPANLQGIWSQYDKTPWTGGYWHNVNVQMNYWPVFNTNLAELFTSYADYYQAYRTEANKLATQYIAKNNPAILSNIPDGNGWTIGTGATAYAITEPGGHSGPGTGGFTSKLFWEQYDFTRDKNLLKQIDYPALLGMGKFLSKVVKPNKDGLLLADPSASPEQRAKGGKYYTTVGCAFDQEMIYENNHDLLTAAKIIGQQDTTLTNIENQLGKLDPIQVGWSGQIKEYREENKYGDIGEYRHRHISQLVALFPGTLINSNTPAWMDAAKVTLRERSDLSTGWALAHRINLWTRVKEGDRAYTLYHNLLATRTLDNLWDTHPPFQIDGNFGATAGVAEMLLQSHEGYIAPLAALPSKWESGSYSGLVARGNFEVSATWNKGQATSFEVNSRVGGECRIYYPNISKAIVTDVKGKKLSFKIENTDLISLSTNKGDIINIKSIPEYSKIKSTDTLIVTAMDEKSVNLSWKEVEGAAYYRVYKAVGNSPTYDLVADKVLETNYKFQAESISGIGRTTFRVTVVGKNGRESNGRLVYINNK